MKKERIISLFLLFMLFFPFGMNIYYILTGTEEIQLKGYYTIYEKPSFDILAYLNSDYQKGYTQYWNNNFPGRNYLLKGYNEIRYSLFGLGSSIIGKNNMVYPEFALDDLYCISEEDDFSLNKNREKIDDYVKHLESINQKLDEKGICLIIYTTPNKAFYFPENVPYRYKSQQDNGKIRAYEYFKEVISDSDLNYIDSNDIISGKYPVFYSTGVHWSRTAEQEMSTAIINKLKENIMIAGVDLGTAIESDSPFWRDTDGWDLLNVIRTYKGEKFYEYSEKIVPCEEEYIPRILIQGGSYSEGLRETILNNNIGVVNYINYRTAFWNSEDKYTPISEWEDLDIKNLINTDAIVIEINESVIKDCSSGFVEYLDNYFE